MFKFFNRLLDRWAEIHHQAQLQVDFPLEGSGIIDQIIRVSNDGHRVGVGCGRSYRLGDTVQVHDNKHRCAHRGDFKVLVVWTDSIWADKLPEGTAKGDWLICQH